MSQRSLDRRFLAIALLSGAFVGTLIGRAPTLLMLAIAASIGMVLSLRPALLIGCALLVEEVYDGTDYFSQAGPLLIAGHQLYEKIKGVTPILMLLGLGLTVLLYTGGRRKNLRIHMHGADGVGAVLVAMILWCAMLSLAQEERDFAKASLMRIFDNTLSAVTPWLVMLIVYAIAVRALREPDGRNSVAKVVAGVLLIKGSIALVVLATTGGTVVDGQHYLVYYDAALPMVAGMALVGYLAASRTSFPWRRAILIAAAIVVVFSFRRAVWSAMAIAVVLLPLTRQRAAILTRIALVAVVLTASFLVLPKSVKTSTFSRVTSAVSVARGTGTEDSARHHEQDVQRGFVVAKAHPYVGIGVRAPQRREFAANDSSKLYVHNDLLQVWLRFGLPGIALFISLLIVLATRAMRVMSRTPSLDVVDAAAAALCLVLVVPLMTAPFVSDTERWPIIVALAAAVLRVNLAAREDTAANEAIASAELEPTRVAVPA